MEELMELVESKIDLLRNDNAMLVCYKKDDEWNIYIFLLKDDKSISTDDLIFLKWIKGVDKKAVVMEKGNFIEDYGNILITSEEIAGTIKYEHEFGDVNHHNNISKFLEQYAEGQEVQTLKFDKKKFLKSEMGVMLCNSAGGLYSTIICNDIEFTNEKETSKRLLRHRAVLQTLLTALKQCYGVEYHFVFNDTGYGLFSPDTQDWLQKIE